MLTTLTCPDPNYELEMLQNNRLKELLPFDLVAENGAWKMAYDITGQQSLDSWMETEKMDADVFSALLFAIGKLYDRIAPYLISEEKICLQPDHIFIRNGTVEFSFCFLPELQSTSTDPVRELLEYLIAKIDHHDDRLVQAVYQAYEKTGEPAYGVLDLIGQNAAKGWDVCLKEPGEPKRSTDEEPTDPLKEEDFVSEPSQEKKSLLSGLFTKPKKKERKAEQAWFIVDEEEEADGPVRQETPLYEETKKSVK